jgi:hypothetical protein
MKGKVNVSILLKTYLSVALKTNKDFCIEPLTGYGQAVSIPNEMLMTKEGIDVYFQHKTVKDDIHGKIHVTMPILIGYF